MVNRQSRASFNTFAIYTKGVIKKNVTFML